MPTRRVSTLASLALAALAVTASDASAEIITLSCDFTATGGQTSRHGVVIDTDARSLRFDGRIFTVEGSPNIEPEGRGWFKVIRFDSDVIVIGSFLNREDALPTSSTTISRITGVLATTHGSGQCARAQAAF